MKRSRIKASPPRRTYKPDSREYCFVIMSYRPRSRYDRVYKKLCGLIEDHTVLRCVRADREPKPGCDLLGKVHEMILRSSVVIADVTEYSPNVYYEYGYASAHDRLPILIAKQGVKLPTDLVGKEVLRYRGIPAADTKFARELLGCIERDLRSPLPEQRRMLASQHPFPAFLLAAPRVPGEGSKHWWHPDEYETFGDMIGILGILTAYGNLFGTHRLPDLLHAQSVHSEVLRRAANFFCIGSPKVNKAVEYFLPRVQQGLSPTWQMPKLGPRRDPRVIIKGDAQLDEQLAKSIDRKAGAPFRDYGLIIRSPHPDDAQHLVMVLAGRHSIGTSAACLVATRQELIGALEGRLKQAGVSLRDTRQPFWAIVRGTLVTTHKTVTDVDIVKVGGYTKR